MKAQLPDPPAGMSFADVQLFFVGVMPGDSARGRVPCYHHRILVNGADVGQIDFRVGDTDHVRRYAGHVGYQVKAVYRGHGYAGQACRALAPLLLEHYDEVILTTDPDNAASIRTIEHLGASFLNEEEIPPADRLFASGSQRKRRYLWAPGKSSAWTPRSGGELSLAG